MDRNPKSKNRYTPENPPENDEAAKTHIVQLQVDIDAIDEDIKDRTIHKFNGDETAFNSWKQRATGAIKYKKREQLFLKRWLEQKKEEVSEQALQKLQEQVATLGEDYRKQYSPVFGIHNPAKDLGEATDRFTTIMALQAQLNTNIVQLRAVVSEHGVIEQRRKYLLELPLQSIATEIEMELHYLKSILNVFAPETTLNYEKNRAQSEEEIAAAKRVKDRADNIASKRPLPYNDAENPPLTPEEARTRLDLLSELRKNVDDEREKLMGEFREATNTNLPKWVRRPLSQLRVSLDEETNLLNNYIREINKERYQANRKTKKQAEEEKQHIQEQQNTQRDELTEISQRIREQASALAEKISEGYTQVYTNENSPQSATDANDRLEKIVETKKQLQAAFSEITEAWCSHPLRRDDMPLVKKPLTKILDAVEAEMTTVKAFLKQHSPTKIPKNIQWKSICAHALTRASFEGFKLTPEERDVVTALLAEINHRSTNAS